MKKLRVESYRIASRLPTQNYGRIRATGGKMDGNRARKSSEADALIVLGKWMAEILRSNPNEP
jgi:hypothetical protein